ncbi:hypothetical protein KL86DES1_21483 [uncultured Desulfovibrio sp.]|uniref:Uncharacterized protein n=1 Tax=uncultured Desulfovibrio sp. TaxID=167968 RepID=A0A212L818_9BACT|nr:hypothetical protein KL86DES1_21483 [uncultured Desulfovibrio sp.]
MLLKHSLFQRIILAKNVVCAKIHATSWRLPPLRQQSNFKRQPLGDEEALRMARQHR